MAESSFGQNPIHVTYLWHMHQPIYYPYESVNDTDARQIFNFSVRGVHDQRTGAYGEWPKNAVQQGTDLPHAGVQVSFSGSLMENMTGLYGNGWREHYRWGRNGLRTARNNPRLDLVGIAYHHSLMPLTTKEAMRMQVRLHKEAYRDVWNTGGSYSKGFWPPECAFDVNMIPALVDEGIDWVIVDNGHFDRACQGYPWAPASSIRPNKADQLNPDPATLGSQWVQLNNVWAPTKVSAPWGYQPRYVQYVDPNSSPANPIVKRIIAVPAGRYEGNENARGGYGAFKPEMVWGSNISVNNNPQRPMLILCHSDGDNFGMLNADAYNGQHGNFLNMTRNNPNFKHTSVQDYLELYPVPTNEVIHVEPGTWVGIDGGTPYYDKWRENNAVNGEHPDLWSWSVLIAAANRVIHADNLENNYSMNDVRWGIGSDTARAWRFYLQAETSCHWYWDFDRVNPWDGNATRGANLAIAEANKVINRHPGTDRVGPTIWPPQRDIYNPGAKHYNEATNQPSNFNVFTFVDDVSGLQNVKLYWRTDNDGENPILEYDNELYAHNPAKNSAWNVVTMSGDWYPAVKGPLVPEPANRAMRYQGAIQGQTNKLIDYFVEAVDNKGNTNRSDIDQVWVGAASTGGGAGGPVVTSPETPVAGQPVTITYSGSLAAGTAVNIHHGFNGANWTAVPGVAMTKDGEVWKYTYTVPTNATTLAMVFNFNGQEPWDNNGGNNYSFSVTNAPPPTDPPPAPTGLAAANTTSTSTTLSWNSVPTASGYVLFRNGAQVTSTVGTNHTDIGLTPETTYTYFLLATNSAGPSQNSLGINVTTSFAPLTSSQISLVQPSGAASVTGSPYFFRGRAGSAFTNGLIWTNPLNGQSGQIAFPGGSPTNGWEWSANIPLGPGSNRVTFTGLFAGSSAQVLTDSPTNYTSWSNGATGGSGFGAWALSTTNGNAGNFFGSTSANLDMNVGSSTGFGLWGNPGTSTARRDFNTPMAAGDSFNLLFDNNNIATGGEVGFALTDSSGNTRFRFYFVGGQSNYRITDVTPARDSGLAYANGGLNLTLTLTASNTYTFSNGATNLTGTLASVGGPISRLIVENKGAGDGNNLYIGSMTHTRSVQESGSNSVNAATLTYTPTTDGIPDSWWGSNIPSLQRVATNDYDGDGIVNLVEYGVGGSPTNFSLNPLTMLGWTNDGGTNYLRFTFRVRTNDAALKVEPVASTNLTESSWGTNGAGQKVSGTPVGDGEHEDQVWQVPADGSERKFLRLRVTK